MTSGEEIHRQLQALLAGADPSPAFAAGVRARLVEDAVRRTRRRAIAWALGGTVCAASLALAVMDHRPSSALVHPAASKRAAAVEGPRVRPDSVQLRGPVERSHVSRLEAPGAPRPAPTVVEDVAVTPGDPRVLVPDDQRIALVRLLQRLRQGRATVPASIVPAYDKDGLLVALPPIVIAPLPGPTLLDPDDNSGPTRDSKGSGKDKQP
jgi:hypothetical protein